MLFVPSCKDGYTLCKYKKSFDCYNHMLAHNGYNVYLIEDLKSYKYCYVLAYNDVIIFRGSLFECLNKVDSYEKYPLVLFFMFLIGAICEL